MAPLTDEAAAIAAINTLTTLSDEQKAAHDQIQAILHDEENNTFVDIHELFHLYNVLYFRSLLLPSVEVSWSARLTLCAGMCELVKDDQGQYKRVQLKLSEALLKYRPRSDTINTLIHEAIHAYFFLTAGWLHSRGDDGSGHGPGFLLLVDAINNHGNYEVTVYHTFHDEVDSYRTHVWKCDGPCQHQSPHFGLVKRSMNRPPSKNDTWWTKHEKECGGTYTKIMAPELTKSQLQALSAKKRAGRQKNKIDAWATSAARNHKSEDHVEALDTRKGASSNISGNTKSIPTTAEASTQDGVESRNRSSGKRQRTDEANDILHFFRRKLVTCPICDGKLAESDINNHIDVEHPG